MDAHCRVHLDFHVPLRSSVLLRRGGAEAAVRHVVAHHRRRLEYHARRDALSAVRWDSGADAAVSPHPAPLQSVSAPRHQLRWGPLRRHDHAPSSPPNLHGFDVRSHGRGDGPRVRPSVARQLYNREFGLGVRLQLA